MCTDGDVFIFQNRIAAFPNRRRHFELERFPVSGDGHALMVFAALRANGAGTFCPARRRVQNRGSLCLSPLRIEFATSVETTIDGSGGRRLGLEFFDYQSCRVRVNRAIAFPVEPRTD